MASSWSDDRTASVELVADGPAKFPPADVSDHQLLNFLVSTCKPDSTSFDVGLNLSVAISSKYFGD